jgi:hypothetical protein
MNEGERRPGEKARRSPQADRYHSSASISRHRRIAMAPTSLQLGDLCAGVPTNELLIRRIRPDYAGYEL